MGGGCWGKERGGGGGQVEGGGRWGGENGRGWLQPSITNAVPAATLQKSLKPPHKVKNKHSRLLDKAMES